MHFTCRSFIGNFGPLSWSQFWECEPDNPQIAQSHGHLFGLISISTSSNSGASIAEGKDFIEEINHLYFSSDPSSLAQQLKKAVTQSVNSPIFNFSRLLLVVAVIHQDQLYLVSSGQVYASLLRGFDISTVLTGQTDQVNLVAGPVRSSDKILLYTSDFNDKLGWESIKNTLNLPGIQQIEQEFLSHIYAVDGQSQLSAALIQIHQENLPLDQETAPPSVPEAPLPVPPASPAVSPFASKISLIHRLFPKKSVFVSAHDITQITRRKKFNFFTALLLLLLLIVASFFGYRKNQASQAESQYQAYKTDLIQKLTESEKVKNLDLNAALDLANQANQVYQKMESLKLHPDELPPYQQQLSQILAQTGSADVFQPAFYFDTTLIGDSLQFTHLRYNEGFFYLADFASGRIDEVNVSQKSTKNLINSPEVSQFNNITLSGSDIYLYNNSSLSQVQNKKLELKIDFTKLPAAPQVVSFQIWNGNYYLLDSQNNTIWKFSPSGSGFSAGQKWLKEGQNLPASPASLAINGQIWVLSQNGSITPFTRGVKDNFSPSQPSSATQAANLLIGVDTDLLIFTDNNKLIYVYHKDGRVVSKYNLGDKTIAQAAYDEKNNLIYVLCTDKKIYQINL
ncbi:MAG: hypothetical protein WC686_05150 [Candidatus Shapirobacteria bacterium]|jgi:hypothetical protein